MSSLLLFFVSCFSSREKEKQISLSDNQKLTLHSSDSTLLYIFNWAVSLGHVYYGDEKDPVGPWYEAASIGRNAFCARDLSHQCISAELLNYNKANLNMFGKFMENISESKDWCTYWEINRFNRPTPENYLNDNDFWFNLNANFELLYACYRLYKWTGNETYIQHPAFDRFFRITLNEYLDKWQLTPEKIMSRPVYMNITPEKIRTNHFGERRGLASYSDFEPDVCLGSDLLAIIYQAHRSYAEILTLRGQTEEAKPYYHRAAQYKEIFDTLWWDEQEHTYHAFLKPGNTFTEGSNIYALINGLIDQPERIRSTLQTIIAQTYNIESKSYLPLLCYTYGWETEAYNSFKEIALNERRIYPEASAGVIEGVVQGMAGIESNAVDRLIITYPHLTPETQWIELQNIPVYTGLISVCHASNTETTLTNHSDKEIVWRVIFKDQIPFFRINNKQYQTETGIDKTGQTCSYYDIRVKANASASATAY